MNLKFRNEKLAEESLSLLLKYLKELPSNSEFCLTLEPQALFRLGSIKQINNEYDSAEEKFK